MAQICESTECYIQCNVICTRKPWTVVHHESYIINFNICEQCVKWQANNANQMVYCLYRRMHSHVCDVYRFNPSNSASARAHTYDHVLITLVWCLSFSVIVHLPWISKSNNSQLIFHGKYTSHSYFECATNNFLPKSNTFPDLPHEPSVIRVWTQFDNWIIPAGSTWAIMISSVWNEMWRTCTTLYWAYLICQRPWMSHLSVVFGHRIQ